MDIGFFNSSEGRGRLIFAGDRKALAWLIDFIEHMPPRGYAAHFHHSADCRLHRVKLGLVCTDRERLQGGRRQVLWSRTAEGWREFVSVLRAVSNGPPGHRVIDPPGGSIQVVVVHGDCSALSWEGLPGNLPDWLVTLRRFGSRPHFSTAPGPLLYTLRISGSGSVAYNRETVPTKIKHHKVDREKVRALMRLCDEVGFDSLASKVSHDPISKRERFRVANIIIDVEYQGRTASLMDVDGPADLVRQLAQVIDEVGEAATRLDGSQQA